LFVKKCIFLVFHIVSPLTGSKATIITTDTTSSPNHAPVFIQAAPRIVDQPFVFLFSSLTSFTFHRIVLPSVKIRIHVNVSIHLLKKLTQIFSKNLPTYKYLCFKFLSNFLSLSTLAAHRHRERLSKGLRYFSKKVCNKVQAKKITSYNEVATELVGEYTIEEKRSLQLQETELVSENISIKRKYFCFSL